METYQVVRSEHLNHAGRLFGGRMLSWVDEFAWLSAVRDFPRCKFVTRAMDEVQFQCQVPNGAILRLTSHVESHGNTSVTYHVHVFFAAEGNPHEHLAFQTRVTLVSVDPQGRKTPLPSHRHGICAPS